MPQVIYYAWRNNYLKRSNKSLFLGPSVMNPAQSCWVTTCLCLCKINADLRFNESQSGELTGPSCWHTISCRVWLPPLALGGINQHTHTNTHRYTVPFFSHHWTEYLVSRHIIFLQKTEMREAWTESLLVSLNGLLKTERETVSVCVLYECVCMYVHIL